MIWGWAGARLARRPATSCATRRVTDRAMAKQSADGPSPAGWRRWRRSAGIWVATGLLFALSAVFQPNSLGASALASLWPFTAVLILAAVGQTLVVQQRGIDLSVPGFISLTVVLVTHIPNGNSGQLGPAILLAYAICLAAGLVNGLLVTRVGITPIVQTLGMNAVLYGIDLGISQGTPTQTTSALQSFTNASVAGIPVPLVIAVVIVAVIAFTIKRTAFGRRFEASGANAVAGRAAGPTRKPLPDLAPTSAPRSCTAPPACCWPGSCPSPIPSRATTTCSRRSPRSRLAAPRSSAASAASSPAPSAPCSSASCSSSCWPPAPARRCRTSSRRAPWPSPSPSTACGSGPAGCHPGCGAPRDQARRRGRRCGPPDQPQHERRHHHRAHLTPGLAGYVPVRIS